MKKTLFFLLMAFGLTITSCTSIRQTSTTNQPDNQIITKVAADLDVSSNRISFYYEPSKREWKCGLNNVINIAVAKALQSYGSGDVLVGLEYRVRSKRTLFGALKIEDITVTGYPATYKNFRNLPDSVTTPSGTFLIK